MWLIAFLLLACESEPPPAPTPTPVATPTPPPKLELADMVKGGKYGDAIDEAMKKLAEKPDDQATWDALVLAGVRSGKAGELVDKLPVDQPIGGQVGPHHTARAVLALAAGRAGDALASALALEATNPGDGVALAWRAIAAGAPAPAAAPPGGNPNLGLLLAAKDPKKPIDPALTALEGWRIALVRAELALLRGDKAGALAEASKADGAGTLAKVEAFPIKLKASDTPDTAWSLATTTADALKAEDPTAAAQILLMAKESAFALWKGAELYQKSQDLAAAAEATKNPYDLASTALLKATAALRVGQPIQAAAAAQAILAAEVAPPLKQAGSFQLALAQAALGNPTGTLEAANTCDDLHKAAATDLAKALQGEPITLPSKGLTGDEAAIQALLAAGWQDTPRAARQSAATTAQSPDLKLWAELQLDRRKAPTTANQPIETQARGYIAGTADAPTEAFFADSLQKARSALATNDHTTALREYGAVAISRPAWRTGPMEPVLAIDGLTPDEFSTEEARFSTATDPIPYAILMHGWHHRVTANTDAWHGGMNPFPAGTIPDKIQVVWDSLAQHRYASLAWAAGKGPLPTETHTALDNAEQDAGLNSFQSPSLTSLRNNLGGAALFSFRPKAGKIEALILTETATKLHTLPASFATDATKYLTTIATGPNVALGDRLRTQLIDPNQKELLGIARYLIVGSGEMGVFPILSLPEQSDGLRYLMSIRSTGYYATLDSLIPANDSPGEHSIDMLGLCATQAEADYLSRSFPNTIALVGDKATLAEWKDKAPKARFIHIGSFPSTPGGAIQLSDGLLTLNDLATTPLPSVGAFVRGPDAQTAMLRGQALRHAGTDEVMVQGWGTDKKFEDLMLGYWWELQAGRASVGRSLSEARPRALRELDNTVLTRPDTWGGFYIFGKF